MRNRSVRMLCVSLVLCLLLGMMPTALAENTTLQASFYGMSATEGGSRWNMIPLDGTFRVEQAGQEAGLLVIENGESSFVALEGAGDARLIPVMDTMPAGYQVIASGYTVSITAGRLNTGNVIAFARSGLFTLTADPQREFELSPADTNELALAALGADGAALFPMTFETDGEGVYALQDAIPEGDYVLRFADAELTFTVTAYTGQPETIALVDARTDLAPTAEPTAEPTEEPTAEPTEAPTAEPTEAPTAEPTEAPTAEPTEAPTAEPTEAPTAEPTEAPTAEPTEAPTAEPTEAPTAEPTAEPTPEPTGSLIVRVESADGGEYEITVTLKNETMVTDPAMKLVSGQYGTIRRKPGNYVLRAAMAEDVRVLLVDGEEAEMAADGVFEGIVTVSADETAEMTLTVGAVSAEPTPEPTETPEPTATPEPTPTPEPDGTLILRAESLDGESYTVSLSLTGGKAGTETEMDLAAGEAASLNLRPGAYVLTVRQPDHAVLLRFNGAPVNAGFAESIQLTVDVVSEATTEITLTLGQEGSLTGSLSGSIGDLQGEVTLRGNGISEPMTLETTDGAYQAEELAPGFYTVRVALPAGDYTGAGWDIETYGEQVVAEYQVQVRQDETVALPEIAAGEGLPALIDIDLHMPEINVAVPTAAAAPTEIPAEEPAGTPAEENLSASPDNTPMPAADAASDGAPQTPAETSAPAAETSDAQTPASAENLPQGSLPSGGTGMVKVNAFWDSNNTGDKGTYERNVPGCDVELIALAGTAGAAQDTVVAACRTDNNGNVTFSDLPDGMYRVRVTCADGYAFTRKGSRAGDISHSATHPTGEAFCDTDAFSLSGNTYGVGAALNKCITWTGRVWIDSDGNGRMENTEPGLSGLKVEMISDRFDITYSAVSCPAAIRCGWNARRAPCLPATPRTAAIPARPSR